METLLILFTSIIIIIIIVLVIALITDTPKVTLVKSNIYITKEQLEVFIKKYLKPCNNKVKFKSSSFDPLTNTVTFTTYSNKVIKAKLREDLITSISIHNLKDYIYLVNNLNQMNPWLYDILLIKAIEAKQKFLLGNEI